MHRHKMDPLSLTFGLGFAALGLVFLIADLDFSILRPTALVPAALVFIGLLLLLMALNRTRERDDLGLTADGIPEVEAPESEAAEEGGSAGEVRDVGTPGVDDGDEQANR